MRKMWVYFKLRLMQLKYDKTGLFFSYIFPVILLLGIGYPVEMSNQQKIEIAYVSAELDAAADELIQQPNAEGIIALKRIDGSRSEAEKALRDNDIQHLLKLSETADGASRIDLLSNSLQENKVASMALVGILRGAVVDGRPVAHVERGIVEVSPRSSYVAILLPGIIAMTLLVIGLTGFGSVLIEEESQGLYKNLKTIDASPVPFFSGLFLSRLLVAYSVALAMFGVAAVVLDVPTNVNYPLLLLVVTLGCSMFLAMGLLVFLLSRTVMAFNGVVSVIQIPLILLGGVFFSVKMFPEWLRPLAEHSPVAPFTSALRDLLFGGVGFQNMADLYPAVLTMAAWLVAFLLLSKWKFRW